jgi:hypothetical protein
VSSVGRSGHRYRTAREHVLTASDICHICGHPGSNDTDHLIPLAVWPDQPVDEALMRPAHGIDGCLFCPRKPDGRLRKCNQERGAQLGIPQHASQSRPW